MQASTDYSQFTPGSDELISQLVEDHLGWATSIAKSVARAWNMDWQLDGLDGGAYEGLLFCARRFDAARGVPFKGYARRRIHEACTEEARKSKSWQRGTGANTQMEQDSREISAKLFDVFPELRTGHLPSKGEDGGNISVRGSIRQLLAGASLIAAFNESSEENPEVIIQHKRLVEFLGNLEPVHQLILWSVYYKGQSMRNLAEEWGVDDLSVIREHREILKYLSSHLESGKTNSKKLKIRRGLRTIAQQMRKSEQVGPFSRYNNASVLFAVCNLVFTEMMIEKLIF